MENLFFRTAFVFFILNFQSAFALTAKVVGTTSTQAVISYSAPSAADCKIEVSEQQAFSPVVNDLNPTLFPNSDKDSSRAAGINSSVFRLVVVGRRSAERAANGKMYSRALQLFTTHYYRITCGSEITTGTFSTTNIPVGNTYSDPLPADRNNPGEYAWPTFSDSDRSEKIIDPETGMLVSRLTVKSDNASYFWHAGGFTDICAKKPTTDASGNIGYLCLLGGSPNLLFWVRSSDGEARALGQAMSGSHPGVDGWDYPYGFELVSATFDPDDPNTFYMPMTDTSRTKSIVLKLTYHGQYQEGGFTNAIADCNASAAPCLAWENLTPVSQNLDVMTQMRTFSPEFSTFQMLYGCTMQGAQKGRLFYTCNRGSQDTYGYVFVFDTQTKRIIAGKPSWKIAPTRWCVQHSLDLLGDIDWTSMGANNAPYQASLTQAITSAVNSCPSNIFGATGNNCTTIQVNGEPCAPQSISPPAGDSTSLKCGDPTAFYLQDAEPGDIFHIGDIYSGEHIRLIAKSGNTWTIQRNLINWSVPTAAASGSSLWTECLARDIHDLRWAYWYWDFINDPHGTNANRNTVLADVNNQGVHTVYRPNIKIEYDQIRKSALPGLINAPKYTVNSVGAWAGISGARFAWDTHPNVPYFDTWYLDGRPFQGWSAINGNAQVAESLSGPLYRYRTNAYGGSGTQLNLNRLIAPTLATCGTHVLLDVSGTASRITNQAADNFKYCVTKNPGECQAGSLKGDVYLNCPSVQNPTCLNAGQIGGNGSTFEDICIGDNGSNILNILQIGIATPNYDGTSARKLTSSFHRYRKASGFWNVRSSPDGKALIFPMPNESAYGNIAGQIFTAKMPPFPVADGVDRTTFLQIPLTAVPPAGVNPDNAVVQFGYAENGNPSDLFCTSRQESCVKGNQPGNVYGFLSDDITGVSCNSSGCVITIPAIPQRVLYAQVIFRDAQNRVLYRKPIQVAATEPPYNFAVQESSKFTKPSSPANLRVD